MGSGIIKNIIICLILVVLAFVVGSMAADGARDSLMVLGAILGGFALLYLGKNCWWLVFVVPPVLGVLPLGFLQRLPVAYYLCGVILLYWMMLRMMGYVRVTWHKVAWIDFITLILFLYVAYSYFLHPVELMIFSDEDTEFVGGKEYVHAIAACVGYVALSIIPCSIERLNKVLKWALFAQFAALALVVVKYHTLSALSVFGQPIFLIMACKYSLFGLIIAPWKLLLLLFALSLSLHGQREVFVTAAFTYIGISFVKKQVILCMLAAAATVGMLTYLSSEGVLLSLPHRIQRTLYILPWLKIDKEIATEAQHSSDWRLEMWGWAMDPRTRYIKDYVWGDGFGQSLKLLRLTTIALNRGDVSGGDQQRFAESGVWHSGVFTTIHRLGIVGLCIIVLWHLAAMFMIIRVCMVFDRQKKGLYLMYHTMPFVGGVFTFYISAGTIVMFFSQLHMVAVAKIAYSEALRTGMMLPLFTRHQYIPLAIREMDSAPPPVTR